MKQDFYYSKSEGVPLELEHLGQGAITSTFEGCRALCQQYPSCVGWSWVSPEYPIAEFRMQCVPYINLINLEVHCGAVSGKRDCEGNYISKFALY